MRYIQTNSFYPRCVDGRPAAAFVERVDGVWQVASRGETAAAELGSQFPGASLAFVRALEVVGRRGRLRAFELVEQVSWDAGLGLQLHLDDDHGRYDVASMSDAALIEMATQHHTGCGFALHAWGPGADFVVSEAKRRGWRVQILTGGRIETGAGLNYRETETFDTASAAQAGRAAFNFDLAAARPVLAALETAGRMPGFAVQAEQWLLETYRAIVVLLGGVTTAHDIIVRR